VTGFGLIGHGSEMAAASGCALAIEADQVPLLEGARALAAGNIPGGGRTNRQHFLPRVSLAAQVPQDLVDLLFDPQTSGGLLVAVAPEHAARALDDLRRVAPGSAAVGKVDAQGPYLITVR
jgi:selenide,water dikinase